MRQLVPSSGYRQTSHDRQQPRDVVRTISFACLTPCPGIRGARDIKCFRRGNQLDCRDQLRILNDRTQLRGGGHALETWSSYSIRRNIVHACRMREHFRLAQECHRSHC